MIKIGVSEYQGQKVISMSGDIDMHSSPKVREQLMALISRKTGAVLVDFQGVTYIDSSGIATFVEGLKGMKSYGGRLLLFGVPKPIMEIFSFSKLDRVFEIYPDVDSAHRTTKA